MTDDHSAELGRALENTYRWRTGQSVGRTIYACPPGSSYRNGEFLIGMMDSEEIAAHVVAAHNALIDGSAGADASDGGMAQASGLGDGAE